VFLRDPLHDTLLSMVMSLLGEVSVLRDRLDAQGRLLEAAGIKAGPAAIDGYIPDEAALAERLAARERMLEHVMRPIRERLLPDELRGQNESYQQILTDVQRDTRTRAAG
jgi:hypothetical protein